MLLGGLWVCYSPLLNDRTTFPERGVLEGRAGLIRAVIRANLIEGLASGTRITRKEWTVERLLSADLHEQSPLNSQTRESGIGSGGLGNRPI